MMSMFKREKGRDCEKCKFNIENCPRAYFQNRKELASEFGCSAYKVKRQEKEK